MDKETAYKEFWNVMTGAERIHDFSDEQIENTFNLLILSLPNDGRLYKYRKLTDENNSFNYAYDGLKNGYIWLSTADQLNDDVDSTFNYDPQKDAERLMEYFQNNPLLYAKAGVRFLLENSDLNKVFVEDVKDEDYLEMVDCYGNDGIINETKFIHLCRKKGVSEEDSKKVLNLINQVVNDVMSKFEPSLQEVVNMFVNFNTNHRKMTKVFSMSSSYDIDTMWTHYADNGFCIEYDYKSAIAIEEKRLLLSTYKNIYNSNPKEFSFLDMIVYMLGGKTDKKLLKTANEEMMIQSLTKNNIWSSEKEWRIVLYNVENKLYSDIVSAVYIDERKLESDNVKKLIALAIEKNWKIYIRKTDINKRKHEYAEHI